MQPGWYTARSKNTHQLPIVYLGIAKLDLNPPLDPSVRVDTSKADFVRWHTSIIELENFLEYFELTNRIANKGGKHFLEPVCP